MIETAGAEQRIINDGTTVRFHDLAAVDVADGGRRALINLFHAQPLPLPLTVAVMEQHPLGSQAFIPLDRAPFLIVVAPAGHAPATCAPSSLTAARTSNYARGV